MSIYIEPDGPRSTVIIGGVDDPDMHIRVTEAEGAYFEDHTPRIMVDLRVEPSPDDGDAPDNVSFWLHRDQAVQLAQQILELATTPRFLKLAATGRPTTKKPKKLSLIVDNDHPEMKHPR